MSAPIQIPATLDGASRRKDKSVSVRIVSNFEMTTDDFARIDEQLGHSGWFLWSSNELQPEDIPTHDADAPERKSKAQRLRAVYFLIHRKRQLDEPFESWYERSYERLLDKLKEELD